MQIHKIPLSAVWLYMFKLHLCIDPNVGNIDTNVGIGIDQY